MNAYPAKKWCTCPPRAEWKCAEGVGLYPVGAERPDGWVKRYVCALCPFLVLDFVGREMAGIFLYTANCLIKGCFGARAEDSRVVSHGTANGRCVGSGNC